MKVQRSDTPTHQINLIYQDRKMEILGVVILIHRASGDLSWVNITRADWQNALATSVVNTSAG
jgi:hypothetical protein